MIYWTTDTTMAVAGGAQFALVDTKLFGGNRVWDSLGPPSYENPAAESAIEARHARRNRARRDAFTFQRGPTETRPLGTCWTRSRNC